MHGEQKIRVLLFCLSLAVFLVGLPVILCFALGYKFDPRSLKFTKTGLIFVKTQPLGASVYLGEKLLDEKTPLTINELLPGKYHVRVVLKNHYPWAAEINVEKGKVTRFDKIILFPVLSSVKQISQGRSASFWLSEKKDTVYYIDQSDNCVYRTDLQGESSVEVSCLPQNLEPPVKWSLSPDKQKLVLFDRYKIALINLDAEGDTSGRYRPFVLNLPGSDSNNIIDVFWHSDSYHLVIVSVSDIAVMEARPNSSVLKLASLNKTDTCAYYNLSSDTLYFSDAQAAGDGNFYENIYKLDLNTKLFLFRDLIKLRQTGYEPKDKKSP